MKATFFKELYELAKQDERVQFIKGDTAYVPDYQQAFPNQYLDVGIAEQNMIGVAAGMAKEGLIPFTYSIVNFASMRCLEQIRNDIAYHNLNVKVVACGAGFDYGALGATHHATEDIAIMRAMPNMTVFSPCDAYETAAVVRAAKEMEGPCFIRNGHGGEALLHEGELKDFAIGRAYQLLAGDEVAVLATGSIAEDAVNAAKTLQKEGIDVGVYSFPTIKPIDKELILAQAKTAKLIVTVEEHNIIGGLGSAVAEIMAEIPQCSAVLYRIGIRDTFAKVVGSRNFLKKTYQIDAEAIATAIRKIWGDKL